jgi:hypothetical protein
MKVDLGEKICEMWISFYIFFAELQLKKQNVSEAVFLFNIGTLTDIFCEFSPALANRQIFRDLKTI